MTETLGLPLSCANQTRRCTPVDVTVVATPAATPAPGVLKPDFGVIYDGIRQGYDKGSAPLLRREGEMNTAVGELAPSFFNHFIGAVSTDGRRAAYFAQREGQARSPTEIPCGRLMAAASRTPSRTRARTRASSRRIRRSGPSISRMVRCPRSRVPAMGAATPSSDGSARPRRWQRSSLRTRPAPPRMSSSLRREPPCGRSTVSIRRIPSRRTGAMSLESAATFPRKSAHSGHGISMTSARRSTAGSGRTSASSDGVRARPSSVSSLARGTPFPTGSSCGRQTVPGDPSLRSAALASGRGSSARTEAR